MPLYLKENSWGELDSICWAEAGNAPFYYSRA